MSLLATYMQDIRAQYPSQLDRDELRRTQTGLLNAVIEMTNSPSSIVSPDLQKKAETSQGRNLDVPVMKKGAVTISNVRSCTIPVNQSDSALVRVVWKTVVANVGMVPSQYEKNEVGYLFDLQKKFADVVEALMIEMENDLETAFDTNKSRIYGSALVGSKYTLVGNAIQVAPANLDFFFNDIKPINFADDFNGTEVRVIANHVVMSTWNKYVNQGGGNNMNTAFQFAGLNATYSNRIDNGVGKLATGYFMQDGSVGLLTRVDVDARMNNTSTTGTEWREETIPGLPFPVGIQYKSDCQDQSALEASGLSHLKSTLVEMYQVSFDYGILVPYNSDITTKAGAIRKFEFIP